MHLIIFYCFCFGSSLQAQKDIQNTKDCSHIKTWDKIKVLEDFSNNSIADVLVITNRPHYPNNENGVIFPNDLSNYRILSYVAACCRGNSWELKFFTEFTSAMKTIDNGRDILFFVHGHGKTFESVLQRAYLISKRFNVSVVVFDWPSKNSNFNKSLSRVRRCSGNFYNTMLLLDTYRKESMNSSQHLTLLAHSLGNYFISHLIVNGNHQFVNNPIFNNVILNSPAIRSKEHGDVLSRLKIGKNLFIISNKNDQILRGANMLTSGKMLGNVILDPLIPDAQYFDFSNIAGKAHTFFVGHFSFEDEHPFVYDFYNKIIHGQSVDVGGNKYLKQNENGQIFNVMPLK